MWHGLKTGIVNVVLLQIVELSDTGISLFLLFHSWVGAKVKGEGHMRALDTGTAYVQKLSCLKKGVTEIGVALFLKPLL